jgi:hypothetical protein
MRFVPLAIATTSWLHTLALILRNGMMLTKLWLMTIHGKQPHLYLMMTHGLSQMTLTHGLAQKTCL